MRISRRPYLKELEAESVVVHTRDDRSIRGALIAVHSDALVLRQAAYLSEDGAAASIDGEVAVPRENVSFFQRLPGLPS